MRARWFTTGAVALLGGVLIAPAAAAATVGGVEAETMTSVQGYGTSVRSDPAASGGRYLFVDSNVGVRKTGVNTTGPATSVVVRAHTDEGVTPANITVLVDGTSIGSKQVAGASWTDVVFPGSWAAGGHTVRVNFTNAAGRNLYLDKVTFEGASGVNQAPVGTLTGVTRTPDNSVQATGTASDPDAPGQETPVHAWWDNGATWAGNTTTTGGNYTLTVPAANVPAGAFNLCTYAIDNAGGPNTTIGCGAVPPPGGGGGGNEQTSSGFLTVYNRQDNDPPNSTAIAFEDVVPGRTGAGGAGTYDDPATAAVPGNGPFQPGDKLYVPQDQLYYVVEDLCGTSWTAPQGCTAYVDRYGGAPEGMPYSQSEACAERNTFTGQVIKNPAPGKPVRSGLLCVNG